MSAVYPGGGLVHSSEDLVSGLRKEGAPGCWLRIPTGRPITRRGTKEVREAGTPSMVCLLTVAPTYPEAPSSSSPEIRRTRDRLQVRREECPESRRPWRTVSRNPAPCTLKTQTSLQEERGWSLFTGLLRTWRGRQQERSFPPPRAPWAPPQPGHGGQEVPASASTWLPARGRQVHVWGARPRLIPNSSCGPTRSDRLAWAGAVLTGTCTTTANPCTFYKAQNPKKVINSGRGKIESY